MPEFRKFFLSLPRTAAEMTLKATKVSLVDIEDITKTTVKVRVRNGNWKEEKSVNFSTS